MTSRLWILALLGAGTGWAADMACVCVARGAHWIWVCAAALAFACAAPIWWAMAMEAGGRFMTASIAWTVTATLLSLVAAIVLDGIRSVGEKTWAAFALCVAAALLRLADGG